MSELSNDALSIFTAIFGFGVSELTFGFVDSQPTARCNAALAELELNGIIVRVVERDRRRVVYKPAPDIPEKTLRRIRVSQSKLTDISIVEPRHAPSDESGA